MSDNIMSNQRYLHSISATLLPSHLKSPPKSNLTLQVNAINYKFSLLPSPNLDPPDPNPSSDLDFDSVLGAYLEFEKLFPPKNNSR